MDDILYICHMCGYHVLVCLKSGNSTLKQVYEYSCQEIRSLTFGLLLLLGNMKTNFCRDHEIK